MIDNDKYTEMVNNNTYLTECQKKEFLYFRSNADIEYVHKYNNKKIVTFVQDYIDDFVRMNKLAQLLYHFCNDSNVVNKIIERTKKNKSITDKKIAKYISHKLNSPKDKHASKKKNEAGKCEKWDYIFQNIFNLYLRFNIGILDRMSEIIYLDVGCGNGNKTLKFAKNFKINKENIYGTDIKQWGPYDQTTRKNIHNFKYILKNGTIDFPDDKFDIVTCSFVLHHVKELDVIFNELKRVIKPNGTLIIIDHNVIDNSEYLLMDIEHLLFAIVYDKKDDYIKNPQYAKYYNYMEWDYILSTYNFKYVLGQFLFESVVNNIRYDNPFYGYYKNIKE
jgi:ubiquinone/menaquinone biosynthesis C-methylase UbiE